ncbi:RICIN domain-containing protein [Streptomyces sp. NPDC059525]|uniref:RICIN domain-containing protein n=1 Tax=Streptomyces sp. NPDC059525 TaxID=3346857 RepID=UPI003685AB5D
MHEGAFPCAGCPPPGRAAGGARQPGSPAESIHGVFQIVNQQTDKCATVAGGLSDNNLELVQFTCDTHPSRRWTLQPG